jgi:hypothetical protein
MNNKENEMTRTEIISAIQANKDRAIGLGYDWPTVDIHDEPDDELLEFLVELEEFLEAN